MEHHNHVKNLYVAYRDLVTTIGGMDKLFSINNRKIYNYKLSVNNFPQAELRLYLGKNAQYYKVREVLNCVISNGDKITLPIKEKKESNKVDAQEFNTLVDQYTKLQKENASLQEKVTKIFSKPYGEELLSYEDVLLRAKKHTALCGVYFLIKDREIIYVGQSVNIASRIQTHSATKTFDCYSYALCNREELNALETKYIMFFKPKLNYTMQGYLCVPCGKTASLCNTLMERSDYQVEQYATP